LTELQRLCLPPTSVSDIHIPRSQWRLFVRQVSMGRLSPLLAGRPQCQLCTLLAQRLSALG
ncbi:hypothetical protein LZN24_33190, partial [Pseudomonas aeruginosa]|nr:hypothetical protein [Pseudomonas aeruginosa]